MPAPAVAPKTSRNPSRNITRKILIPVELLGPEEPADAAPPQGKLTAQIMPRKKPEHKPTIDLRPLHKRGLESG